MKILIVTHYLDNFAGSELFTKSLAENLSMNNHKVFIYSPFLGKVAEKIREKNILVTDNLLDLNGEEFDIIHAQHNVVAILARSVFPRVPMVFMSHGILPELEQPPSVDIGIYKYIVVSEEVKQHLIDKYKISKDKIKIIRNFIDTERFCQKISVNRELKNLMVLSNHYTDEVRGVVEKTCFDLNINVFHVGRPENPVDDVERFINKADMVVVLGRGALEAMACERNVIVYDMHGGDGFINEINFFDIRENNFSGRRYGIKYSVDEFKKELLKYDPNLGKKLRKIVLKENTKEKSIKNGLYKIYQEVIENNKDVFSEIGEGKLYLEIGFLEKYVAYLYKKSKAENVIITENFEEIKQKNVEIKQKNIEIKQKNAEIKTIQSSKFWKMRNKYMKIKNKLFKK